MRWKMHLRVRVSLAVAAALALLIAGCLPSTPQAGQQKILTVAWGIEPKILTVAWVWDNPAASIDQLLFDPLVKVDIMGDIHPDLAESWDISPDGKTYT